LTTNHISAIMTYNQLEKREYMIDQIDHRMRIVESVLADARSPWARQHWGHVLEYFRRQLKHQANLGRICD
jgi:hypothetical protein